MTSSLKSLPVTFQISKRDRTNVCIGLSSRCCPTSDYRGSCGDDECAGAGFSRVFQNAKSPEQTQENQREILTQTHMHGHKPMEITNWVSFVSVRQRLNLSVPLAAMPPGDTQPSAATMGDTQAVKGALNMPQSDS